LATSIIRSSSPWTIEVGTAILANRSACPQEFLGDHPPHRHADDQRALDLYLVEHGHDIVGQVA
jgi:hypothetical protein